ncbi:MAG: aminoacyl-tRNA hydrolase [Methylacidiphilales bacterium]|nr:aminoacyl-tRNA hydrolase [Candidatus Methylacidiphilales bacterium]MDW8350186.1 aminoacyl-tRNA hydrolase [Verrucomicrobiae bacterium]
MGERRRFRWIVGLGNPGERYVGTRHNVGFMVVDELVKRRGLSWRLEREWEAEVAEGRGEDGERYWVMKPMTWMNRSGEAVRRALAWERGRVEEVLVVVDDVALPLGRVRVRGGGGSGGHNGLRSIEESLGGRDYARVRCGVGGAMEPGMTLEEYVLGRFRRDEEGRMREMVERAVDAVCCCQREGLSLAMQFFNRRMEMS